MIFDRLRVFVSSGMAELGPERSVIKQALDDLQVDAWLFEQDAGARSESAEKTFHQELTRADLFIGIFWKNLGQYTKDEFDHARAEGMSCFLYEKRTDIEGHRSRELQEFLDNVGEVKSGLTIKYFDTADELGDLVKQDVARWQAAQIRERRTYRIRRPEAAVDADQARVLKSLRTKVRRFWIEGVLDNSLHGAAMLELDKEIRPDAVANPWAQVLELPDQTRKILSATQSMAGLLDNVGGSLLILGAPGSGKTITLLQLLRELLDRSNWGPLETVPVVFNLSTWSDTDTSLENWLVEELNTKYQIPGRIGRDLIQQQRLFLMLDGLDEVVAVQRPHCARAINEFAASVGVPGIVVCCRLQEYTALPERLGLGGAICLQPLDRGRVLDHVKDAGPAFAGLYNALEREDTLLELATSPLMLDIMLLAFSDREVSKGSDATVEAWRDHIFEVYTERMFSRAVGREQPFPKDVVVRSLNWLSTEMRIRSQSIFLIEQLQPTALTSRWQRLAYTLISRLAGALALGLMLALSVALGVWGMDDDMTLAARLGDEMAMGVIAGVVFGSVLGVIDFVCLERRGDHAHVVSFWTRLGWTLAGMAFCTAAWVAVNVVHVADEDFIGPTILVLGGVAACLIWGRRWMLQSMAYDIRNVEAITWSWKGARIGGAIGLAVGLGVAAIMLISMGPLTDSEAVIVPQITMTASLMFCTVGALLGAIRPGVIETRSRPNQGMWLSFRNARICFLGGAGVIPIAVFVIMVSATAVALFFYPEAWDAADTPKNFREVLSLFSIPAIFGIAAGLFVGTCACLMYGGLELIHHGVLRLVLYTKASIPMKLVQLLDQANGLILLRRVGGGYVFIHRLLLEYFARRSATIAP
jgi:DNA polymerase III delta prime subunit